jgi:hypothetical protein
VQTIKLKRLCQILECHPQTVKKAIKALYPDIKSFPADLEFNREQAVAIIDRVVRRYLRAEGLDRTQEPKREG